MKQLIKRILKAMWRLSRPIRAPFARKFEAYLTHCLRPTDRMMSDETNVLLNHVVRELVRLQRQVESLRQTIEEQAMGLDRAEELESAGRS